MTEKLLTVYVVWVLDGPVMTTALLHRQEMEQWSEQDYVAQAFDAEFPGEPNAIQAGESYELAAIFIAENLHWIY